MIEGNGGWTRSDIIQALTLAAPTLASVVTLVLTKMVKTVHVMINSRMTQMLTGARAEGGQEERGRADERERLRSNEKPKA